MTQETLMTGTPENSNEGQAASQATEATAQAGAEAAQQQQATEGQTAEAQGADAGKSDGDAAKPQGAPEKYEFKAPEGAEFDPNVIAPFSEVAKELNLSQEAAQKVLDKMAPVIQARQVEMVQRVREQWGEQSTADKEFGGDKLNENLAVATKALDQFGTPELRTLLKESGLGNHPEVIRFMFRAGKAISEDGFVAGKAGNQKAESVAQRMYPNMNP